MPPNSGRKQWIHLSNRDSQGNKSCSFCGPSLPCKIQEGCGLRDIFIKTFLYASRQYIVALSLVIHKSHHPSLKISGVSLWRTVSRWSLATENNYPCGSTRARMKETPHNSVNLVKKFRILEKITGPAPTDISIQVRLGRSTCYSCEFCFLNTFLVLPNYIKAQFMDMVISQINSIHA